MIKTFVINLPEATDRLNATVGCLRAAGMDFAVVDAVRGSDLRYPSEHFAETKYRLRQGRRRIDAEVGCYLSHIKALKAFLKTNARHCLILEDDASFGRELPDVIGAALRHEKAWDLLRLSTVNTGRWTQTVSLIDGYSLGVAFTREKGAGGYIVNRKAAARMVAAYLPMTLPYDHRFDLEWFVGLKALGVTPPPIRQTGFRTQIQIGVRARYLHPMVRYWTVFPYRAFCEVSRVLARLRCWLTLKAVAGQGGLAWRHRRQTMRAGNMTMGKPAS